ncbi:MAG: lactate utilization protein [Proteobacteria bacterium]|nr:lactate utilization protein [Pseudomonadota bacterium]
MTDSIKKYWNLRLNELKKTLEENNFEVYVADDAHQANTIVLDKIIPETGAKSVSWGGSMTFTDSGLYDLLKNRAGIAFGPHHVVILAGRNKIVADVDDALVRIKNYAAPANVVRLNKKNPCLKTGYCEECHSTERICNTWTITDKSFPKGRIKIVLINDDMGL